MVAVLRGSGKLVAFLVAALGEQRGKIVHIQAYHEYYAKDESWKNFVLHNEGTEAWEKDKAERETLLTEFVPYMRLHCNLSEQERTAADMLENGEALTPEQTAYFHAVLAHVDACREKLNAGDYHLPDPPQLSDFDKELQDYKAHVESEIAQEAEAAGMTVEEYAANGYEPQEQPTDVQEQPEETPSADTVPEQTAVRYYTINEGAARRANDANSYRDYAAGSATAEYRQMVDQAAAIAQRQKERVDPMYHEKIDALLDTYARKLAENLNDHYAIEARVPSILVAGGSNFPVRKKEKQNAARDRNMQEWQDVQGILDKIRSTGMGGISMDDPQAAAKLEAKLAALCLFFQLVYGWGVVDLSVNHIVVLFGGQLRRAHIIFLLPLLGGNGKCLCAVAHDKVLAVIGAVVIPIACGFHLLTGHIGNMKAATRR